MVKEFMKRGHPTHHKSAIRIIEETVYLLKSAPVVLLFSYYLGGVPFVLGLLYFWADMSRSADAGDHRAVAALGLAFLFVWMKFWQTVFAFRVRSQISGYLPQKWPLRRIASVAATQALIQSTRMLVMPVAALLTIPFGYCYAFYQNATAYVEAEVQDVRATCKWAWRQAKLWPRQNHILIGTFWILGFVIFINVSIAAYTIPHLLKTFLGIDSVFTMSGMRAIFNSTFWITMVGLTYLLLDPFIKTAYVLRCFYGSAQKSGEDLKTELNYLAVVGKKAAAGMLIAVLSISPFDCRADQRLAVSPHELDRSIEETMARREFAWRMPRETTGQEDREPKGPIAAAVKWVLDMLAKACKVLKNWLNKFFEWLESLLPKPDKREGPSSQNWMTSVRLFLISLLLVLLVLLLFVFVRIWRRRDQNSAETVRAVAAPEPDLNDEGIKADDLPTNRWLALATGLVAKGELRQAMRALYLATLAYLAEQNLITIEIYKSNREYERELKRRAHESKELLSVFSKSLNVFERVWYGMYRITRSDFDHFEANHKRILAVAAK